MAGSSLKKNFNTIQQDYLLGIKYGGIPHLLIGKDGEWLFTEVKKISLTSRQGQELIKQRKDKPTQKQIKVIPKMQELGVKVYLAILIPRNLIRK